MKQRELARLQVLNDILEYQVPTLQAAEILGVSERHTRRLLNAYRRNGAAALAHGNRGRRPHNAVLESKAAAVVRLASAKYAGTNHTHLTELLRERDGINLSRPTVRRILVKAGIGSPRSRRSQQHRVRRQGMLVQIDGSHHRWLGKDGPRFALLLTVDDATGTVPAAMFCREEDTPSYFLLMNRLIRRHGIPIAIYSDRHPVFKFTGARSGMLRAIAVAPMEASGPSHNINGAGGQWDACLGRLETGEVDRDLRPRKSKAQQHRIPTARQRTLWENVQETRLRGLSLRAIARELSIHRNTARKYALAKSPPLRSISGTTGTPKSGEAEFA